MARSNRFQKIILLLGDITLLYASLFAAIIIRYLSMPPAGFWKLHFIPFTIINALLILIFYINDFYTPEKKSFIGLMSILKTMIIGGVIAVFFFYSIPYFKITPKTTLIIELLIATVLIWGWRKIFGQILSKFKKTKIFFLGNPKEKNNLIKEIDERPQLGYAISDEISSSDIIIVSKELKEDIKIVQALYEMILAGKTIIDFDKFYESITGKIPVHLVGEVWFLENLSEIEKQTFEKVKRGIDLFLTIIFFVPFIIIFPFISILIKIESRGPVLYRQKRLGKSGKIFEIIKFRSMIFGAEKNGAQWAKENDSRITFIGNILRKTRIDELPQLWNVLKGDLSFVGPRPERPEFMSDLTKKIAHYSMRQIIKPGLSGWAQINFPYGASIEDTMEKTQYDLYYIKNRSFLLDLSILLKTAMVIIRSSGR